MKLTQVSVFVENRPGRLATLLEALAENDLNIRALSIADSSDYGIVRMILSDTEKGLEVIRDAGLVADTSEVLRAEVPDRPGGLLEKILRPLANARINIEYIYAFVDQPLETAVVVLKVNDLDRAEAVLGE
jgi:hypothetical protein